MARFLVIAFLLAVAFTAAALISALSAERGEVRALPRGVWVAVILLLPVLGPAIYFWSGRPARPAPPEPRPDSARRVLAPDDDPEFLARIGRGGAGPTPGGLGGVTGATPGRRTPNRDHPAGADRIDRTGGPERDRTGERGTEEGRATEDLPPTGA